MKWKYTRIKSARCSKWVSGNSWVTKFDDEKYCYCGHLGFPVKTSFIESPKQARKAIENALKQ